MCSSCRFPNQTACPSMTPAISTASTFHWKTLVNGYSGYYPPSYLRRLRRLATLPSPAALDQIRADNVRWVVVHEQRYRDPAEAGHVIDALIRLGALPLGRMHDGWNLATLITTAGDGGTLVRQPAGHVAR